MTRNTAQRTIEVKFMERQDKVQRWALAGRFIGMGWYIGITIVGGTLLGKWLDNKLGTTVIFTLFGLLLGLVLAGLGTYQMIAPIIKDQQNNDKGDD